MKYKIIGKQQKNNNSILFICPDADAGFKYFAQLTNNIYSLECSLKMEF